MAVPFENRNFQKELEKKLQELQQQDVKHLLLHSCCAPCSSYVIEYLSRYFQITVFYYIRNNSDGTDHTLLTAQWSAYSPLSF